MLWRTTNVDLPNGKKGPEICTLVDKWCAEKRGCRLDVHWLKKAAEKLTSGVENVFFIHIGGIKHVNRIFMARLGMTRRKGWHKKIPQFAGMLRDKI
jgi:hypothetical protein